MIKSDRAQFSACEVIHGKKHYEEWRRDNQQTGWNSGLQGSQQR
jgi:hypothetical protein